MKSKEEIEALALQFIEVEFGSSDPRFDMSNYQIENDVFIKAYELAQEETARLEKINAELREALEKHDKIAKKACMNYGLELLILFNSPNAAPTIKEDLDEMVNQALANANK